MSEEKDHLSVCSCTALATLMMLMVNIVTKMVWFLVNNHTLIYKKTKHKQHYVKRHKRLQ